MGSDNLEVQQWRTSLRFISSMKKLTNFCERELRLSEIDEWYELIPVSNQNCWVMDYVSVTNMKTSNPHVSDLIQDNCQEA